MVSSEVKKERVTTVVLILFQTTGKGKRSKILERVCTEVHCLIKRGYKDLSNLRFLFPFDNFDLSLFCSLSFNLEIIKFACTSLTEGLWTSVANSGARVLKSQVLLCVCATYMVMFRTNLSAVACHTNIFPHTHAPGPQSDILSGSPFRKSTS